MKVLILAGGLGSRISEETNIRPKPMVEIGGKPILHHIMKIYSHYGFNDFVVLCGYKGDYIKSYFSNYFLHASSVTFDLANNTVETISSDVEPWRVTLLDTGLHTLTAGRIRRAKEVVGNERFLLTYGDGVADVDINKLIEKHERSKKALTMTAVQPVGRFGALEIDEDDSVTHFQEKPAGHLGWINGGFFVCEPKVFDYIEKGEKGDAMMFEREPFARIVADGQMNCYKHEGFWKCMDTLADQNALEKLWNEQDAEWKVW